MATTRSGLLYSWGQNDKGELGIGNNVSYDEPKAVEMLKKYNVETISAGDQFSAAVTSCGKLFTWGFNKEGQLMLPKEYFERTHVTRPIRYPEEVKIFDGRE